MADVTREPRVRRPTWRRWKSRLNVAAAVGMLLASSVVIWTATHPPTIQGPDHGPTPPPPPNTPLPAAPISLTGAALEGRHDAAVVLLEFSDYQCPYCGRWHRDVMPTIKTKYLDTGQVLFAYQSVAVPGHAFAPGAAAAAECAGDQGQRWEMHDLLFADQKSLDRPSLLARGRKLALDGPTFEQCLSGDATATLRAAGTEAKRLGVIGTPTFLVGLQRQPNRVTLTERLNGVQTAEALSAVLDALLKRRPQK